MLRLWLIRHGQTEGNRMGRYTGVTDEPLSPYGAAFLEKLSYPQPEAVYISPLSRCVQTAGILFPGKKMNIIEELAECDFGDFENKSYKELSGNPDYQRWIDSGGTLPFPGGESREAFRRRSIKGFQKCVTGCIRRGVSCGALVIHGGTIMNIMEVYCEEKRTFYEWHVENGGAYEVETDPSAWKQGRRTIRLVAAYPKGLTGSKGHEWFRS